MAHTHLTYHKATHRPLTTAHLAQTMTLLAMNNEELIEKIEGDLANNPALELVEGNNCPSCHQPITGKSCPRCSFSSQKEADDPVVFLSSREDHYSSPRNSYSDDGAFDLEDFSPQTEDLATFVLRQIGTELEERDRPIVAHILTSLDEDGLLEIPISEVALYHHVPLSKVKELISQIQRCEPAGVASPTPKDALLVQLDLLAASMDIDPLAITAIADHWDLLTKQQFRELAKSLRVSQTRVKEIAAFISENLNPFPGRAHWGNVRHHTNANPQRYHRPDVIVSCYGDEENPQLIIEVIWPLRGMLRLNPHFQKAIAAAPNNKADQWNSDHQKASLLIKCLGQRNHTLIQLMENLAKKQKDFILKGDAHTKPITRAQIADELSVHESTISRAVAGKSIQLPSGKIIPIAKFFDRSLHIRTAMKKIIHNEPNPLSDTKIAKILAEQGYNIARRTVAKYRSVEGIMPAHMRT